MAKVDIKIEFPDDAEFHRLFATVPILERYKVLDKTIRAATVPIVRRAKELAPRSSRTGSTKRWSKKVKDQREGTDWNYPLWKTVKATIRKYEAVSFAAVGPAWPRGNKVFFNSAHVKGSRTQVLWGRRTGRQIRQTDNWIKRAGDETRSEQNAAMLASLRKTIAEMMPRG